MLRSLLLFAVVACGGSPAPAPVPPPRVAAPAPALVIAGSARAGGDRMTLVFGPPGGVPIPTDLKRALQSDAVVVATLDGIDLGASAAEVELHLVDAASDDLEISAANLVGIIATTVGGLGPRTLDVELLTDFVATADELGPTARATGRTYLASDAVTAVVLVAVVRTGSLSLERLRVAAR